MEIEQKEHFKPQNRIGMLRTPIYQVPVSKGMCSTIHKRTFRVHKRTFRVDLWPGLRLLLQVISEKKQHGIPLCPHPGLALQLLREGHFQPQHGLLLVRADLPHWHQSNSPSSAGQGQNLKSIAVTQLPKTLRGIGRICYTYNYYVET